VDRIDAASLADEVSGTFVGQTMIAQARQMCAGWPRFAPQPALFEPATGDVPTLLVSGAADPVTPQRWATMAAKTLTRSREVVARGAGHGAGREGCTSRLIAAFVASASVVDLNLDCLAEMRRPPFFVRRVGSAP
jgi:pimeloyl-ACP methyl ester carboxylesterase